MKGIGRKGIGVRLMQKSEECSQDNSIERENFERRQKEGSVIKFYCRDATNKRSLQQRSYETVQQEAEKPAAEEAAKNAEEGIQNCAGVGTGQGKDRETPIQGPALDENTDEQTCQGKARANQQNDKKEPSASDTRRGSLRSREGMLREKERSDVKGGVTRETGVSVIVVEIERTRLDKVGLGNLDQKIQMLVETLCPLRKTVTLGLRWTWIPFNLCSFGVPIRVWGITQMTQTGVWVVHVWVEMNLGFDISPLIGG